ncbi:EthD domain-containing protein, partial [Halobium palmae]
MYKHVALLVRKPGTSHEAFVDHWQNDHTPIAREIEGVVKYDAILPVDAPHAEFDGIAELYFEDLDALHDALGSEGSRDYDPEQGKAREARGDVNDFLAVDERLRIIGRGTVQKDETRRPRADERRRRSRPSGSVANRRRVD